MALSSERIKEMTYLASVGALNSDGSTNFEKLNQLNGTAMHSKNNIVANGGGSMPKPPPTPNYSTLPPTPKYSVPNYGAIINSNINSGDKINFLGNEFKKNYNSQAMINNYKQQARDNFNNTFTTNEAEAKQYGMGLDTYKAWKLEEALMEANQKAQEDYNLYANELYNITSEIADDYNKKQTMNNIANYKKKYGEDSLNVSVDDIYKSYTPRPTMNYKEQVNSSVPSVPRNEPELLPLRGERREPELLPLRGERREPELSSNTAQPMSITSQYNSELANIGALNSDLNDTYTNDLRKNYDEEYTADQSRQYASTPEGKALIDKFLELETDNPQEAAAIKKQYQEQVYNFATGGKPKKPKLDMDGIKELLQQMYEAQQKAELERIKRAQEEKLLNLNQSAKDVNLHYNQGIDAINRNIDKTKQAAQIDRNSQGTIHNQNVLRLREAMADMGLSSSGANVQNLSEMQNQHMSNLNSITIEENNAIHDYVGQANDLSSQRANELVKIDEQIAQLKNHGISEQNELVQRLLAEKNAHLVDLIKYGDERAIQLYGLETQQYNFDKKFNYDKAKDEKEWNWREDEKKYNREQDNKNWEWREDEKQYNRGQDKKNWEWKEGERDYNRGRDKVTDEHWQKGWDRQKSWHDDETAFRDKKFNSDEKYKKEQLALAKSRASGGGGGYRRRGRGRSGGYGGGSGYYNPNDYIKTIYKNPGQYKMYLDSLCNKSTEDKLRLLNGYSKGKINGKIVPIPKEDKVFAALMERAVIDSLHYEGL